jgi:predicted metal-dependent enzyme (double-stranded beta helix superfamily)
MTIDRLRQCAVDFTALVSSTQDEAALLAEGRTILSRLIAHDDWLPDFAAAPDPQYYRQYLLHCDPLERFSIVSFVWGPGQKTPVHDHTVWGLIGVLRGKECSRRFEVQTDGSLVAREADTLLPGDIDAVSPAVGDIHEVFNGLSDRPSISIHVYGANIGKVSRHVFDPVSGAKKSFVSGYSNDVVPNLWGRV